MKFVFLTLQNDTLTNTANTIIDSANQTKEATSSIEFLMKGGVFLIPIIILLFYTIYIVIERFLAIKKATKKDPHLIEDIKTQLNSGRINDAYNAARRSNTATGNILASGISTIGRPIGEIETKMDKQAEIEIGEMEKKLGHLGLVASVAPILGFIGTISGVIKIFYDISISEDISIGNISGGLYEKMICSGAGLVVAVIAYTAYHLFNSKIDNFVLNVQKQSLEFLNTIQQPSYGNKKE